MWELFLAMGAAIYIGWWVLKLVLTLLGEAVWWGAEKGHEQRVEELVRGGMDRQEAHDMQMRLYYEMGIRQRVMAQKLIKGGMPWRGACHEAEEYYKAGGHGSYESFRDERLADAVVELIECGYDSKQANQRAVDKLNRGAL